MRGMRFVAALALICTNSLLAGEPSGDAALSGDIKPQANCVSQPPYVIQRPYIIEPPDVISIEPSRQVPKAYRVKAFDVVKVQVVYMIEDPGIRAGCAVIETRIVPLDKEHIIKDDGAIDLGAPYGSVRVAGMTIDEVKTTLNNSLRKWFIKEPTVSVQLVRVSGAEPVMGQYLVGPNGTINLRQYGIVNIAGKTVIEAQAAVQHHLKQFLDLPELSVNVVAYNSKAYYVITQDAGKDDNLRRLPITGIVTVFDAISQENNLSPVSNKKIWIARPLPRSPTHPQISQILPINWNAITQGAEMATNYQILPGDRLYVADEQKVSRKPETIENFQGNMATGDSTIRGQTMGRNYNRSRNGL